MSSRMTDTQDEEEDERDDNRHVDDASARRQPSTLQGRVQGLTGPVGEAGVPPSRPSSAATGKSGAGSQAAPSRRMPSMVGTDSHDFALYPIVVVFSRPSSIYLEISHTLILRLPGTPSILNENCRCLVHISCY
jgi:hypothetical protein